MPKDLCLDAFRKTEAGKNLFEGKKTIFYIDDNTGHCARIYNYLKKEGFNPIVVHYSGVEHAIPLATEAEMREDERVLAIQLNS